MFYWKAKYIIINKDQPVIFSETFLHASVAIALAPNEPITGAGFVEVGIDGSYKCYGESISLKVKSNGEADSKILNKYLGGKQDDDL